MVISLPTPKKHLSPEKVQGNRQMPPRPRCLSHCCQTWGSGWDGAVDTEWRTPTPSKAAPQGDDSLGTAQRRQVEWHCGVHCGRCPDRNGTKIPWSPCPIHSVHTGCGSKAGAGRHHTRAYKTGSERRVLSERPLFPPLPLLQALALLPPRPEVLLALSVLSGEKRASLTLLVVKKKKKKS